MYLIILTLIGLPFFFYKLGQSSLTNWDEAWYAEIAKQIGKSGDIFIMHFNGSIFTDHPPAGFWLIRFSQLLFGTNAFGSMAISAFFGLLGVIGVYLLGKKLFTKTVGFVAAIALLSAPWFLFRARSANLDVFLTTFFIYTIYFAVLANEQKKYLTHFFVTLTFLFLTKTMVPFTVLPALLIVFLGNKEIKGEDVPKPLLFFAILTGGWVLSNRGVKPDFLDRYFMIGLPGVKAEPNYLANIKLVKEYIHNGIGKWFWPGLIGVLGGIFTFQKRFLILSIISLSLALPFIFSERGHIWHMIPIYPFLLLSLFGLGYVILRKFLRIKILINLVLLGFCLFFFIPLARANWYNFVDIPAYISDEEILSTEARKYMEPLFIDDDFIPAAVFYSDKDVKKVDVTLQEFFEKNDKFLLITKEERILNSGVNGDKYEILKKDRDKVLIRRLVLY